MSMKRMVAVLVIPVALAACSSSSRHTVQGHVVRLVGEGSQAANAYAIAYQACGERTLSSLAKRVGTSSTDPARVAAVFARTDFVRSARAAGTRGCLDAVEGRSASPPGSRAS